MDKKIKKLLKSEGEMLMKSFGFILVMCALVGCASIEKELNIPEDNIAEELIEDAIKIETGISVDLTPSTPE